MSNRWVVAPVALGVTFLAITLFSTGSRVTAQATSDVVINELMYHPESDIDGEEYVELTNTGVLTADLSGWRFSDGFDYIFPTGTLVPPGGYLIVAHDPLAVARKYGLHPQALLGPFVARRLSNAGERVALSNAVGDLMDVVTYDDDSPWPLEPDGQGSSLELINPDFPNDSACAWAASTGDGTPGARNSVYALDIPPCVENVIHSPVFPVSGQPVIITAAIYDNESIALATVHHKRDETTYFAVAQMVDDGSGSDAVASDGIYTAQLPPYTNGALVGFYVEATDNAGLTTRVPQGAPGTMSSETGGPITISFLFLVEDAPPTSSRPIYRLLVTVDNWTELTTRDVYSNELLDASFIFGGDVYYNVGLRYRGESSRTYEPKGYRINFSSTHLFNQVEQLNLVADDLAREALTYDLFHRAGMTASDTEFVDLYINSGYQALYLDVEEPDEAFLAAHMPGDDAGNLYRGKDGADLTYRGPNPEDYRDYYLKKSNEAADDYADVIALTDALDNSPDESFQAAAETVADMNQWLRWFALNAVVFNQEAALFIGHGDDYFLYHRPSDDRFILLPWDHDGGFYTWNGDVWAPNLPIVQRILRHPLYTRLYYQNIASLMANEFSVAAMHPRIDALPFELDDEKNYFKAFVTNRINYLSTYFQSNVPDRSLSITTNGGVSFSTTQRSVVLEGECSPWRDVYVNGSAEGVSYPTIHEWRFITPPLRPRANRFEVADRDGEGNVVHTHTITVTYDTFDGGTLNEDLTLTSDASPHIILEDIIVPTGRTLTVEPGVTVALAEDISLFVEGRLLAEGTAEQPIIFTRDVDTDYWGVIGIYRSRQDNRLSHLVVEYAGQANYRGHAFSGVGVYDGQLTLEDGEIRDTSHTALDLLGSTVYVRRNRVHNAADGSALRARQSDVAIEENLFYNLSGGHHGIHLINDTGNAEGAIHANVVYNVQGDCVRLDGANVPVERNELHHCIGAGVSLSQTASVTITNNLIRQNVNGIVVENGVETYCAYNTLVYNSAAGVAVSATADQITMVNSIVWDNGTAISYTAPISITVSYSDIQGGWSGPGEGNINADPRFLQPTSGIFRLVETSPCVDQGTPLNSPLVDLMGVARPKGTGYDMGAYEFFEYYSVHVPFVMRQP